MWSIVAREVNFGMAVAFMISTEQRAIAIETVVCADISHSDICYIPLPEVVAHVFDAKIWGLCRDH